MLQLYSLCDSDVYIPNRVKRELKCSSGNNVVYQESKVIAGILDCLNYSDYMKAKGKDAFVDVSYMHLSAEKPLVKYPQYITHHQMSLLMSLLDEKMT